MAVGGQFGWMLACQHWEGIPGPPRQASFRPDGTRNIEGWGFIAREARSKRLTLQFPHSLLPQACILPSYLET